MTTNVKPGWYPTREKLGWLRWWNGRSWIDSYWPSRLPVQRYLPDAPRFDISVPGEPRFDIVGENWREAEILAALKRSATPRDIEFEEYTIGELVPEPDNPHDRRAISVRIDGHVVGYLPSEDAPSYRGIVGRFVTSGIVPQVRVRIWGVTRYVQSRNRDELKSAIRLALPAPDEVLPTNLPPSGPYFLIPPGRVVQVTGEEHHLDALNPYLRTAGSPLIATLHPIPGRAKDSTVLEVRLDGVRVGQLTPAMSGNLMPLVRECESNDRVAASWATVTGSRLAAEVRLRATRAEEIDDSWPSDADTIPIVGDVDAPPPAYSPQVALTEPPVAKGLSTWLWAVAVVVALVLSTIPYVGWLVTLAAIGGAIWWHVYRRRQAPSYLYTAPRV